MIPEYLYVHKQNLQSIRCTFGVLQVQIQISSKRFYLDNKLDPLHQLMTLFEVQLAQKSNKSTFNTILQWLN